jgi:hypothetical protein
MRKFKVSQHRLWRVHNNLMGGCTLTFPVYHTFKLV